jgi:hypothetical protein
MTRVRKAADARILEFKLAVPIARGRIIEGRIEPQPVAA